MELIIEKLKYNSCRSTTNKSYLSTWRRFNNFIIKLDRKPNKWEDRVTLFIAHLFDEGAQSRTIKSYVSAIKKILVNDGYEWNDELILLGTLTKACRIINDQVKTRLPIQFGLLEVILFEIQRKFCDQPYLKVLYKAMFALGYYGMFRAGELCQNAGTNHTIKAHNVHVATNKEKILVILNSSKTHGKEKLPQKVKITSNSSDLKAVGFKQRNFCLFSLIRNYIMFRNDTYETYDDPLFIFRDGSPVKVEMARNLLKLLITNLGLDASLYGLHSLRIGRTCDLVKFGFSMEEVKQKGRWTSNTVYKYMRA